MAVVDGTILGITALDIGRGLNMASVEETYLVTASFGAYDASADTASLSGVGAAITAARRDERTRTLRAGAGCGAAKDDNAQDVYFGAMTVSTDDFTFSLTAVDRTTEVADFTSVDGVPCVVVVTATA